MKNIQQILESEGYLAERAANRDFMGDLAKNLLTTIKNSHHNKLFIKKVYWNRMGDERFYIKADFKDGGEDIWFFEMHKNDSEVFVRYHADEIKDSFFHARFGKDISQVEKAFSIKIFTPQWEKIWKVRD